MFAPRVRGWRAACREGRQPCPRQDHTHRPGCAPKSFKQYIHEMEGLKFPTSVPGILLNVQEGQVTKVKDPLSGGAMCGTCSRTSQHFALQQCS